ncbi:S-layer homology domain-containing protein [Cohnella fermenti]|uniref:S-layer homology domain-containing protein n=1 Tax=Cohnella fermenti TaxID=2565925 RepID=A0A4S4BFS4_9BACL|nr:S-layer homology domain-containing protein [Cohnella fermenti]
MVNIAAKCIMRGYADGTFRPNQTLTRVEAVTLINKLLCFRRRRNLTRFCRILLSNPAVKKREKSGL